MVTFPETPIPQYPMTVTSEWKTLKTDFSDSGGKEQRRQIWAFPKRSVALKFEALKQSDIDTLWAFFNARKGSWDPFWFFYPLSNADGSWPSYTDEYVSTGNGSNTIFELPGKNIKSSSLLVYVNGVQTAVTFLSGGGDAGVDRIQFSAAPAFGTTITAYFAGQIRYRVRFKEDKMSKELFVARLYNSGLELQEIYI